MKVFVLIGMVMISLLFVSCKKCHDASNPTCSDYNPCYGQQPITANFKIYEMPYPPLDQYFSSKWAYYDTDSVLTNLVTFRADITDAKYYEWHIGASVYHSDTVTLDFTGTPPGSIIPIELIIQKTPDTICFPKDNGIDTVIRYMKINSPIVAINRDMGSYQGYFTDSPNDSVFFNFYQAVDTNSKQLMIYVASNYFPGNAKSEGGLLVAEKEFAFEGPLSYSFDCLAYADSTGLTTIYTEVWSQAPPITRIFVGRKN